VGIVIVAVPALRLVTRFDEGVRRYGPIVTLKVVPPVSPNPKPVSITTEPVGPLVGVTNKAVMAMLNVVVAFNALLSVPFRKYPAVGKFGMLIGPVKFPLVSAMVNVARTNVPAAVEPNRTVTDVPESAVKPVPVKVIVLPGPEDVGVAVTDVVLVTLNPFALARTEVPGTVPSVAVIE